MYSFSPIPRALGYQQETLVGMVEALDRRETG